MSEDCSAGCPRINIPGSLPLYINDNIRIDEEFLFVSDSI